MNISKVLSRVHGYGLAFAREGVTEAAAPVEKSAQTMLVGDSIVAFGVANDLAEPANDTDRRIHLQHVEGLTRRLERLERREPGAALSF